MLSSGGKCRFFEATKVTTASNRISSAIVHCERGATQLGGYCEAASAIADTSWRLVQKYIAKAPTVSTSPAPNSVET